MRQHQSLEGIARYMDMHGETLAVAESVTAGHLQAALSLADGALNFFQGGITAYNAGQKSRHLGIDPIHALACNSVSERIAKRMAQEVSALFICDWGIGITGYAAPLPAQAIESPFCYYAISYKGHALYARMLEGPGAAAADVQAHYAQAVLHDFQRYLQSPELFSMVR